MSYFDKIKDKATFIAFPVDDKYGVYDIDNINRLPVSDDTYKYKGWKENGHHYTTQYHRDIVIPKICELFGVDFDFQRDFHLDSYTMYVKHEDNPSEINHIDLSMPIPNNGPKYDVYSFVDDKWDYGCNYEDLIHTHKNERQKTEYHTLYKYGHCCSKIINKTIDSDRKLLIDGDSQIIPSIMPLSCYFKEVWYFDNRTDLTGKRMYFEKELNKGNFTDILIQFWFYKLEFYINNLK